MTCTRNPVEILYLDFIIEIRQLYRYLYDSFACREKFEGSNEISSLRASTGHSSCSLVRLIRTCKYNIGWSPWSLGIPTNCYTGRPIFYPLPSILLILFIDNVSSRVSLPKLQRLGKIFEHLPAEIFYVHTVRVYVCVALFSFIVPSIFL